MRKNYECPSIKLHEITNADQILAGSDKQLNSTSTTHGLGVKQPEYGGISDGDQEVGAKNNTFSVWSNDE